MRDRDRLAKKMTCRECSARMFISPGGYLVCERGCGRLIPLEVAGICPPEFSRVIDSAMLRRIFPERSIESAE